MLGDKGLECFRWSAEHDPDEEFLRRYGEPSRAAFMTSFFAMEPTAVAACERLRSLL